MFSPQFEGEVDEILNFIDEAGKNVIIAVDSEVSDPVREIASELGIDLGPEGSAVIDHLNFDITDLDGDHTLIIADDINSNPIITGGKIQGSILFRGTSQTLEENELLIPILRASPSAYGASPDDPVSQDSHKSGNRPVLISALQARNNARVLFSSSLDMFSDKFFTSLVHRNSGGKAEKSGNRELAKNLVGWTLKERGVLRSSNVTHHLVGDTKPQDIYKVTDDLFYSVRIEEWDGLKWGPYKGKDVQLEFTMLDPYIRTTLKNDGQSHFTTTFKIPDVYGIFTFRIRYQREGYTNIVEERIVTVRPFLHNEYERFIVAAYPYYASAFSMLIGLFIFSVFFLFTKEEKRSGRS